MTELTIITLVTCRDSTVCVRRARCHDVKALESTVPGTRLRHLDRDASACIAGRGETDCLNNYMACGGSREGRGRGRGWKRKRRTRKWKYRMWILRGNIWYCRQFEEGKHPQSSLASTVA